MAFSLDEILKTPAENLGNDVSTILASVYHKYVQILARVHTWAYCLRYKLLDTLHLIHIRPRERVG